MMVPEYIRFYNYTAAQVLNEFAVTFFSLANSMYRLQAKELLNQIRAVSTGMAGKEGSSVINELTKQEKGVHGIVEEVKVAKSVRESHD